MTKRLYFGNLSWNLTEGELVDAVSQFAPVQSARIITDRETGRSRGFGFVDVEDGDAEHVIASLNGRELLGRPLVVSEARETRRPGGFNKRY